MKLSEFKDEKGIEVVAKLLVPICNIVANPENEKAKDKNRAAFLCSMLQNSPKDVMDMLAILNDQNPEDYHCNAASVLKNVLELATDKELMELFGAQGKTGVSSGSASENTEAPV